MPDQLDTIQAILEKLLGPVEAAPQHIAALDRQWAPLTGPGQEQNTSVRRLREQNLVVDHFACQLSTTVKGCAVVCSTGIATRNRLPSLVAFASENHAPGVRNRS
jgi:hypothetical protein